MTQDAQLATEVAQMTAEHRAALKDRLGRLLDQQAAFLGEPTGHRPAPLPPKERVESGSVESSVSPMTDDDGHDLVMPQLGEDVREATLVTWLKHIGDRVELDEPLFEISTEKVDSEIPSPYEGVLSEILVSAGETVSVGTAIARVAVDANSETAVTPDASDRTKGTETYDRLQVEIDHWVSSVEDSPLGVEERSEVVDMLQWLQRSVQNLRSHQLDAGSESAYPPPPPLRVRTDSGPRRATK